MYLDRIRAALPRVRESIQRAAEASGRSAEDVKIIAVTKGHPVSAIHAAIEAGLKDVGENRAHELEHKVRELTASEIPAGTVRWHMIGHLQRRQARTAVEFSDLIHSVDSLRLGERLSRMGAELEREVAILIQVNTSGESAKSGLAPAEALEVTRALMELPRIRVEGFMTMAPFTAGEGILRTTFRGLRELRDEVSALTGRRDLELSMGMSNDFSIAVEEGSTMVRIGTALLGERPA